MADFNLREYNITLLRLYRKDTDEVSRLMEDLEYYMLETTEKTKYLFLVAANKFDIYIIWKDSITDWNKEKLSLIISNSLKKTRFMHLYLNGYNSVMGSDFWDEIKESIVYFKNVKKYRKALLKKEAEEEIKEIKTLTIDEILNKINESGMDGLTEDEKQTLKNHNDEDRK